MDAIGDRHHSDARRRGGSSSDTSDETSQQTSNWRPWHDTPSSSESDGRAAKRHHAPVARRDPNAEAQSSTVTSGTSESSKESGESTGSDSRHESPAPSSTMSPSSGPSAPGQAPESFRNLVVSCLPYAVDSARLRDMYGAFGPLVLALVMIDVQSGRSRGFGFVWFKRATDAQRALAATHALVLKEALSEAAAHGRPPKPLRVSPSSNADGLQEATALTMLNWPATLTNADARACIEPHGRVTRFVRIRDPSKRAGLFCGLHVTFETVRDARAVVLKLHGVSTLQIKEREVRLLRPLVTKYDLENAGSPMDQAIPELSPVDVCASPEAQPQGVGGSAGSTRNAGRPQQAQPTRPASAPNASKPAHRAPVASRVEPTAQRAAHAPSFDVHAPPQPHQQQTPQRLPQPQHSHQPPVIPPYSHSSMAYWHQPAPVPMPVPVMVSYQHQHHPHVHHHHHPQQPHRHVHHQYHQYHQLPMPYVPPPPPGSTHHFPHTSAVRPGETQLYSYVHM